MHTQDNEVTLTNLFLPFTTKKAIVWIILIGFVVFFNALFNGFVWDDKTYLLFNPQIRTFDIRMLLGPSMFNDPVAGYYRPIPGLYFTLLYNLFKTNSFFYHLSQLSLHILCSSLFFIFLKKFLDKKVSFILALLFLILPIQVESVVYIAQTVSPLLFLFGILALLTVTKDTLQKKEVMLLSTFLLFSLLIKETGIIFPIVCITYRFLFKKSAQQRVLAVGVIVVLLYFAIRFGIGHVYFSKIIGIDMSNLSLLQRLLNVPAVIFYYLKTTFLPLQFAVDQKWVVTKLTFSTFYFPLLIDSLFFSLLGMCGYYLRTSRKLLHLFILFFVWFGVGIGMHLQIFPLDMTVADRWFYVPLAGLLGMGGVMLQALSGKLDRRIFFILACILLIVLSIRTMVRNANWSDAITLYTHDIQVSDNYDLENTLGYEYSFIGNYKEAINHINRSIQMLPYESNYYNAGTLYVQLGDSEKAIQYFTKAATFHTYEPPHHKHYAPLYKALAWQYLRLKSYTQAQKVAKEGLQDYPQEAQLWEILALSNYGLQNQKEAINNLNKAMRIAPSTEFDTILEAVRNKKNIDLQPNP